MKFLVLFIFIIYSLQSYSSQIGTETGLKIPRYVSIKSNEVNVRVGPSQNYPISIKYVTKNVPIEIIEEHKEWRKILDYYGNTGWIKKNLLQGDRYAIIKNQSKKNYIYFNPIGFKIGEIKHNNIVKLLKCRQDWCYISYEKYKGWIKKSNLWGAYKNELLNAGYFQIIEYFYWEVSLFVITINKSLTSFVSNLNN